MGILFTGIIKANTFFGETHPSAATQFNSTPINTGFVQIPRKEIP